MNVVKKGMGAWSFEFRGIYNCFGKLFITSYYFFIIYILLYMISVVSCQMLSLYLEKHC